jgi:hypothetical protein
MSVVCDVLWSSAATEACLSKTRIRIRSAASRGRNNPDLDFALDLIVEAEFNGVHPEFLDGAFKTHVFGFDWMSGCLQSFADVTSDDRTVEVVVLGGVRFDGGAVFADSIGDLLKLFDT